MINKLQNLTLICFVLAVVAFAPQAYAQNVQLPPAEAIENTVQAAAAAKQKIEPSNKGNETKGFNSDEYASLVFTFWEYTAIKEARSSRGLVRAPTDSELMRDLNTRDDGPESQPTPEEREVVLGGIVYKGKGDWTIWLNSKRVTPDALPEEVIDLRVYKDYIEMKWLDEYTNQIFPLRLRPHQRFNMDARMFLPG